MPVAPDDSPDELVFVYGVFRKGASNHSRLKKAPRVAEATIRGRLVKMGWFPALVLDPQAKTEVMGDVFRVKGELLQAFLEYEGQVDGAKEGQDFRLVHAKVQPVYRLSAPLEVRLWVWTGDTTGAEELATGDWLDVECPKSAPFFFWIAGLCTMAAAGGLAMATFATDKLMGGLVGLVAILALGAGWVALDWAIRRRERAELLHFLVVMGLLFSSIIAGLFLMVWVVALTKHR